ncbi:MAG: hypothetical protein RSE94_11685 [Pseudomonas sp.]
MSTLTPLESRLLAALREQRRLGNQTVKESREVASAHREMDELLKLEPYLDEPKARYDAPHRKEHREFVNRMFAYRR